MAHRLIWSPRAASHLEDICEHIAQDSDTYAAIFAQRVLDIVRDLPKFPQSGRVVPEYNDSNLRERIYGNYRIVYRLQDAEETIEVAAICHSAR